MFDDIIKNKANEHEAPVPHDAWNNIIKQKKKRRFAIFWWTGIVVLLAGLSVTGYLVNKNSQAADFVATAKNYHNNPVAENSSSKTTPPAVAESKDAEQTSSTTSMGSNKINEFEKDKISKPQSANKSQQNTTSPYGVNAEKSGDAGKTRLTAKNKKRKIIKGKSNYNNAAAEQVEIMESEPTAATATNHQNTAKGFTDEQVSAKPGKKPVIAETTKVVPAVTDEKKTAAITKDETTKEHKTPDKQPNKHHWFIEAGITALLPAQRYDEHIVFNRTLFLNNNLTVFSARLVNTSMDPSMAFSLSLRRECSKKVSVGIGLQYLLLKENILISGNEKTTEYSLVQRLTNGSNGPVLVNDTVATVTEGIRSIGAVNSYHLFSIPVFAQYSVVQKRSWSLGMVAGVYVNISSSYQNEINRNAAALLTSTPATTDETTIGLDVFAGLRLAKTAGRRVELFALPSMRWNLHQNNIKNSLLNKTINQAGLSVGMSYKLK